MKNMNKQEYEAIFLSWVREALDDGDISGDDNFLDVGGNSLLAVELLDRYEKKYGKKISMLSLLQQSINNAVANSN
ncbi:acyl carrier protein [Halomonas sp. McH1-25]|uniref:acyl carrier protein n=1 Tax=unclassified Halomonas TaxID=2609666 RepID=UPI001EF4BBD4|nr:MULTISPECIES: acyl carrier protein [unclassified Halomonas]MCG7601501.1 acyl carrier protein [Halomonas sp. McH1-25]MCP1343948.1 acyl carrier protein [Halomonas sp. FL8]MCP1361517.1 acyl carrier protein [Halomonas sp. BBD45]MCP1363774.1 acyl carrier protein [Halomonas sp. BBD48]